MVAVVELSLSSVVSYLLRGLIHLCNENYRNKKNINASVLRIIANIRYQLNLNKDI